MACSPNGLRASSLMELLGFATIRGRFQVSLTGWPIYMTGAAARMRTLRKMAILTLIASATVSTGCSFLAQGLLNGLVDSTFVRQFPDGREEGGLTRAEKRARFEEQGIRFMLRDRAYSQEERVPALPY
jgi:hypothetical protein